ncbi:MAG: glycosyltransferase family 39 protein [Solirubrobacterales bacterium]|nr:glycosyltransferase family 39 protein [Solirubrobacterales bacterium]
MAGSPRAGLPARVSARVHASPYLATALGLTLLVAASLYLRTQAITAKFWIDEGLSVGIAHHGFWDIPTVLQQDGSPPLYYLLLHVWMAVAGGDGEARTHALSVALAMLAVPAAFVLGRLLFGARAGWAAAALTATLPFLTYYAQETRMYALIAFLGLVAAGAFGLAYGLRERRALPVFAVATAAMLYTHNWGAFLAAGLGIGWLVLVRTAAPQERRPLVRDGLLGFGAAVVLYLPWVPTLLEQARHTGAPWAERPPLEAIVTSITSLAGGTETGLLVLVLGIAGLLTLQEESRPRARAALGIGVALGTGIALAWLASQASPAWSTRYFSVFVGPALLLAGAGLVRFGKVGLVALALVLVLWFDPRDRQIKGKSDVYRVARTLQEEGLIKPNDLVVTAHPEQGPLLRYYLGPDYRFADAMGPVPDTRVFDWRDALDRLEAAGPRRTLDRLAPSVSPGQHLVLMLPIIRTGRWGAPWTELVRRRSAQWERAVDHDKRFQRIAPVPEFGTRPLPRGLRAVVYLRR